MSCRRVLMVWELGAGLGHVMNLARLGQRLAAQGCEITAALRVPDAGGTLAAMGARIEPAPPWTRRAADGSAPRPFASLPDSLAEAGLWDVAGTGAVIARWQALFERVRPDLVVADFAPLAAVTMKHRAPVLQIGAGFGLPPAHLDALPHDRDHAEPAHAEADLLTRLNLALGACGLGPLERMAELFGGAAQFVTTFPLIDPYVDDRQGDDGGPLLSGPPLPRRTDAAGAFAYLHGAALSHERLRQALLALGTDLDLLVPDLDPAMRAAFQGAGVTLHAPRPDLAPLIARARLVIHQGGAGLACEALAAGVPQYLLSWHVEQHLTAQALAAAGVARAHPLFDAERPLPPRLFRDAMADAELSFLADAAGRMHRQMLDPDPLARLTTLAMELIRAGR